ncbi:unnamed protein product [Sphacelaria rigidula]
MKYRSACQRTGVWHEFLIFVMNFSCPKPPPDHIVTEIVMSGDRASCVCTLNPCMSRMEVTFLGFRNSGCPVNVSREIISHDYHLARCLVPKRRRTLSLPLRLAPACAPHNVR